MGRTKQLLPLGDRPVIAHAAGSIAAAGIRDIVVVTGRGQDAVRACLTHLPVRFAFNDDPESDMAESIRIGLREMAAASGGVLVCLADHPLVSPGTIGIIIHAHESDPDRIIIPVHKGKRGHPSLFPAVLMQEMFVATGPLRDVITRQSDQLLFLDVPDEGVVLDMDTEEDYRRVASRYGA
jgi:molybdenum cofactor cytidylyltransferase